MSHAVSMAALLDRVVALPCPSKGDIELALDVSLTEVESANRFFDAFEFDGAPAPLPKGTVRIGRERAKVLLVLRPGDGESIGEADLDLEEHFGGVDSIDPNPGIPPEGTVAYRYRIGEMPVWFQFTARSKVLLLVSIEWG